MELFLDVSDRGHYTTKTWCSIDDKKACSEMVLDADLLNRVGTSWIISRSSVGNSPEGPSGLNLRPTVKLSSYYEGIPDLIKAIKRAHDEYLLRKYINNY